MTHRVPVGRGRDGSPIYVNMEFLDGTRGAHVSISGISGVATKTSFALFLLHSIFRSGVLGARAVNAKALVFSVKGEDLLFLDQPNVRLDDDLRSAYAELGLPAEPFASAGFWAPPIPDDQTGRPNVTGRTSGVEAFWWTIAEFCSRQLLPYAFADAEDERHQYTIVIHQVAMRLRMDAVAYGENGAVRVDDDVVTTYEELVDVIVSRLTDETTRQDWAGPVTGVGTINAFIRRLRSSLRPLRPIIRADMTSTPRRQISTQDQQVTVVDLHNLHERAQRFVVGVVLAAETARKEDAGPGGLLFTMIDELNKYAPREGNSPIKDVLLDIAERGRSLGIILIGAQQTASEVERRIVSNSAIRVVGRLDSAEAGRPEYGFLPASQRIRATLAKPGAMFISQPEIPVPLAVEFPFPAWATRLSECVEPPHSPAAPTGDVFSRLPAADDDIPPF
jgi:DNA helicase HerA-like ATPase